MRAREAAPTAPATPKQNRNWERADETAASPYMFNASAGVRTPSNDTTFHASSEGKGTSCYCTCHAQAKQQLGRTIKKLQHRRQWHDGGADRAEHHVISQTVIDA